MSACEDAKRESECTGHCGECAHSGGFGLLRFGIPDPRDAGRVQKATT